MQKKLFSYILLTLIILMSNAAYSDNSAFIYNNAPSKLINVSALNIVGPDTLYPLVGVWEFAYTLNDESFVREYTLEHITKSEKFEDEFYVIGSDKFGNPVIASFIEKDEVYTLLANDTNSSFDNFFVFHISGHSAFGSYYQVEPFTLNPVSSVPFSGIKTAELPLPAPVPDPAPECEDFPDCDDAVFCNGEEQCVDGECRPGEMPCGEEEVCVEDVADCWDIEKLTAQSNQNKFFRPLIRPKRCPWLVLNIEGKDNFPGSESSINLFGPGDAPQGVKVDSSGETLKVVRDFILVPICIDKDATIGQWQIEIETYLGKAVNPFKEIIEYGFEVE